MRVALGFSDFSNRKTYAAAGIKKPVPNKNRFLFTLIVFR
ncbi:Hypothetical protein I595_3590 [Croceitalea dokdonensis DOKDO 023]|uniref:Uncharacterized protein n=1 Tax=Croceitalea dokdonensis DOKDO 023 TaxID=1300341 RepID=A0A0P7AY08_9FLAO|nr:Hypothetical protein I595_3590 [Croceitalea dokdonensis DOKDO 023]